LTALVYIVIAFMLPFHRYSHVLLLFAKYMYSVNICMLHEY